MRVSEHHDQGNAEKLHAVFQAGKPIVIDKISRDTNHKQIARAWSNANSGETRESAQPRIAAIGYCAPTRAARPAEKSLFAGLFAA